MEDKIKILYAEDSADWAETVKQIIEPHGFEVEIAKDGNEAWEKFQSSKPDMVLLDIEMPGRNGWELIKEMKIANEWMPIVLYSAHYSSTKLLDSLEAEAEDFLDKTCAPEELANRLLFIYTRAMNKRKAQEVFKISELLTYNPLSRVLTCGEHKEVLKLNESRILNILCRHINTEVSIKDLCEGIWGKGMDNDTKHASLKTYISNLRKPLSVDPSVSIEKTRYFGYILLNIEKA